MTGAWVFVYADGEARYLPVHEAVLVLRVMDLTSDLKPHLSAERLRLLMKSVNDLRSHIDKMGDKMGEACRAASESFTNIGTA